MIYNVFGEMLNSTVLLLLWHQALGLGLVGLALYLLHDQLLSFSA